MFYKYAWPTRVDQTKTNLCGMPRVYKSAMLLSLSQLPTHFGFIPFLFSLFAMSWEFSDLQRFNPHTSQPWGRDFEGADASVVDLSVRNYGSSFGTDAEHLLAPSIYSAPAVQSAQSATVSRYI